MIDGLKAIIFDVDDTLYDRTGAQFGILRIIMQKFSDLFSGTDEQAAIDAFIKSDEIALEYYYSGTPGDESRAIRSREFLRILGLNDEFADAITKIYVDLYPTIKSPVKGAESVVATLDKKYQLGIVSNGLPDVQYRKLKVLNLEHFFECIVLSGELGIQKPDPRIFWEATSILNKKPEECLYIGDHYEVDIPGAKSAGMKACWFNPNGLEIPQIEVKPDFILGSLDEIIGIVDSI